MFAKHELFLGQVKVLKKVVQNMELEMMKEKNRFQRLISKKTAEVKKLTVEVRGSTNLDFLFFLVDCNV